MPFFSRGGGFLVNLDAIELSQLCQSGQNCKITTPHQNIENNGTFIIIANANKIEIQTQINAFINYGTITPNNNNFGHYEFFKIGDLNNGNGHITNLINYGTIKGDIWVDRHGRIDTITNYGYMGGVSFQSEITTTTTINNLGIITWDRHNKNIGLGNKNTVLIQNYMIRIDESATTFESFKGQSSNTEENKTSHLVTGNGSNSTIRFKDSSSKIILDFGNNFEFGKEYLLDKLILDTNGTNKLKVDFSRLSPFNDIYTITKSGTNGFKVELKNPQYGTIGTLYKSNIRTMNNFQTISDSMIYPHKYKNANSSVKKRVIRRVRKTASLFDTKDSPSIVSGDSFNSPSLVSGDKGGGFNTQNNTQFSNNESIHPLRYPSVNEGESILLLKQNESFAYKSNSLLLADLQEQRQRRMRNSTQNLNTRSTNQINNNSNSIDLTNRTTITNQTINRTIQNDKYYFILTPFVQHNYFFELGHRNLSGLEYGFVTAFNGKENDSNSLGAHFIFSYASLKDSNDSIFNITTMNLNMGANYKLDLIWDMYVKARIDGYYFLNEVQSTMTKGDKIKPNSFGFGVSVSYGKEWDFRNDGLLGLEVGIDYKGLYADEITINALNYDDIYKSALYNMLYLDLGLNYDKYFNTNAGLWGLNTRLGVKANATANKLAKSKIAAFNNTRNVNMTLDNDLILAYLNIAGSYVLQSKDFDMEFSLAFYGNYGNRVISNGGGFEWRVEW